HCSVSCRHLETCQGSKSAIDIILYLMSNGMHFQLKLRAFPFNTLYCCCIQILDNDGEGPHLHAAQVPVAGGHHGHALAGADWLNVQCYFPVVDVVIVVSAVGTWRLARHRNSLKERVLCDEIIHQPTVKYPILPLFSRNSRNVWEILSEVGFSLYFH